VNTKENQKDNYDFEKNNVIKSYFKRIYTVLDETTRKKLLQLDISTDELRQILKYIAFLPKEKQETYLKELTQYGKKPQKNES
jgi:hypothetical protein